ncbi:holo-[acyl-carrier-protein] synthase [soil metagenome]
MIIGVGIDMIEVDRVTEKVNKDNGFREKIFSEKEIAFCESKKNRTESYAARFAAKEAFLKATGFGLTLGHQLSEIEVINDDLGKPSFNLIGSFKTKAIDNSWNRIHLSISHLQNVACAVVIIEQ